MVTCHEPRFSADNRQLDLGALLNTVNAPAIPFFFCILPQHSTMSGPKQRLQAVSQQLAEGIPDAGKFEDIPKIRQVAGDSVGP